MKKFNWSLFILLITMMLAGNALAEDGSYYTVQMDYRKCMYPMCGGFWLTAVNGQETECADHTMSDRCYVVDINWKQLRFSDEQIQKVEGSLDRLIVRGNFAEMTFDGLDFGTFNQLEADGAWLAATDSEPEGWFVRLYDNGIRCFTTPCYSIDEEILNYDYSFTVGMYDLSQSGATDEQIELAGEAVFGEGLVATGYHRWYLENWRFRIKFVATQIYLPIEPAIEEKICKPTGCSGQICSETDLISTCEWRPEYGCIRQQICEVQNNGMCGWTPTVESAKCFADLKENELEL